MFLFKFSAPCYFILVFGGHYVSYCKSPSGHWCKYNDGKVSRISIDDVIKRDPFSLFYVRSPELDVYWPEIDDKQKIKALRLKEERKNKIGEGLSMLESIFVFIIFGLVLQSILYTLLPLK